MVRHVIASKVVICAKIKEIVEPNGVVCKERRDSEDKGDERRKPRSQLFLEPLG